MNSKFMNNQHLQSENATWSLVRNEKFTYDLADSVNDIIDCVVVCLIVSAVASEVLIHICTFSIRSVLFTSIHSSINSTSIWPSED